MMKTLSPRSLGLLAIAVAAMAACDRASSRRSADAAERSEAVEAPAPRVTNITLGKGADSLLRVTTPTSQFRPRDTMFLAVEVSNPDSDSRLSARWTFQDGTVMDSSGQGVDRDMGSSASVTQFRVWRDAGWRPGSYTVAVWLDDALIDTKTFTVRR
jgi:hypothetical protein